MSERYAKLLSSILGSSIWGEDDKTRLVWITMLAMADRHGYVGASIPGLARMARVPSRAVERAIEKFLAPDPHSRSPENEGRRIERADRGWNILNYERFRDMRDEDARREYERERKRAQRAGKPPVPDSPGQTGTVPPCPAPSPDVCLSYASAVPEAPAAPEQKDGGMDGGFGSYENQNGEGVGTRQPRPALTGEAAIAGVVAGLAPSARKAREAGCG